MNTPLAVVASSFGVSELALERHVSSHPRAASPDLSDEEGPATSRCPTFEAPPVSTISPTRLCRLVLKALERHPEAERDVRAVLEREVAA